MASSKPLFKLVTLPIDNQDVFTTFEIKLKPIEASFALPELDEKSTSSERLLKSLRNTPKRTVGNYESDQQTSVKDGCETNTVCKEPQGVQGTLWDTVAVEPTVDFSKIFKPLPTWDCIQNDQIPKQRTPFLSEKSAFTFDAVLNSLDPPSCTSGFKIHSAPILDSTSLLKLMMRSTLGTLTTDWLVWDKKKSRYTWDERGGRPLAIERLISRKLFESLLSIGTATRRLEIVIDTHNAQPLTPTHHALLHGISTYLTYIKERLTNAVNQCLEEDLPNWNKWILITKKVRQLSEYLCQVVCWPLDSYSAQALPHRGSSLLSHLYSHLVSTLAVFPNQHHPVPIALAYLLGHSTGPFFNLLHSWLGLESLPDEEYADPTHQPWTDLGITRQLVGGRYEYKFSSRLMPAFIPNEAKQILFEAGKSMRILDEASKGQHPLCDNDWGLETKWLWGEEEGRSSTVRNHIRKVRKQVENWQHSHHSHQSQDSSLPMAGKLGARSRKERKEIPTNFRDSQLDRRRKVPKAEWTAEVERLSSLFSQSPGTHLTTFEPSHTTVESLVWAPIPLSSLHEFVSRHSSSSFPLLPPTCPTLPLFISTNILSPLLAHATLISTSLVSLYLKDLHLLDHLDVLKAFWLGGDVGFLQRVGGALFGKDSAGAGEAVGLGKRARTRARLGLVQNEGGVGSANKAIHEAPEWGIGLGIGLSERSRWPPGGAELAYALRMTMMDEDLEKNGNERKGAKDVWIGIEDRVLFTIRELPKEGGSGKRAKWLNPQAIEALDFLYLSYSPTPAISAIFSQTIMERYQSIHNLLLRLLRVDLVLRTMYWDVVHQFEPFDEPLKFGVDSGLDRPSHARHSQQIERRTRSLFPKDTKVDRHLQLLRFKMTQFVNVYGRYVMDHAIKKWDVMRKRLGNLQKRVLGREDIIETDNVDNLLAEEYQQMDDDEETPTTIYQLRSIRSLILYHQLTLNRICTACLLGPQAGQQVTFKLLMVLFGLVLDLGKAIREVEMGLTGWEKGAEKIAEIGREWEEKEATFLHALERVSLHTVSSKVYTTEVGDDTEQDLEIFMAGERGTNDEAEHRVQIGIGTNDLQVLLLRLRPGRNLEGRRGRWQRDDQV
ncbi:hypothetical protein L204_103895 [Cryptococcus depauperatus]